jgi:hypothetical protein
MWFIIKKVGLNQSFVKSIPDHESAGVVKPALELVNHTADELHVIILASGRGLVDKVVLQGDPEAEGFGERGFRPNFGVDQEVFGLVHLGQELGPFPDPRAAVKFVFKPFRQAQ